jgi:NADH-quinone oxidoreductase subunit J
MVDFLFYLFAALTLGSAAMVIASRSAVSAAMFLILAFVGLAALFVLLEAYFLAVLQVLIYAGAVVVLFLFIIMLLDVKARQRHPIGQLTAFAGVAALALLVSGVLWLFSRDRLSAPDLAEAGPAVGSTLRIYGQQLFTTYLLPVQVTGFLLLIAMIGVIVLGRRPAAGGPKGPAQG